MSVTNLEAISLSQLSLVLILILVVVSPLTLMDRWYETFGN